MSRTVHITFDEHDLPGQWVDLRDPRFLSKRTIDRWQREVEAGMLSPESFLHEFVAAWHLLDADTAEELNSPASDSIDGIPLVVFQVLNERVGQLFRGPLAVAGGDRPPLRVPDGDPGNAASSG